jgi:hypothetical protein
VLRRCVTNSSRKNSRPCGSSKSRSESYA